MLYSDSTFEINILEATYPLKTQKDIKNYLNIILLIKKTNFRALVSEFYRTGVEETSLGSIFVRLDEVCSLEGREVPSLHAAINVAAR